MHFIHAKQLLISNGMNIYRGCTHGCIYCDSRSNCYQMKHAFEDIEVKQNAPMLLEQALRSKRSKCMISTGSMCDPYMHCEEQLQLTRQCLQIIDRYGFGAAVQTKSDRILRDLPILKSIHHKAKCVVEITMTTYDETLCHIVEPNVCGTKRRFEVLCQLRDAGIPTVVWLCPLLPFINDTEENLRGILQYCIDADVKGIICFGMGLTLREGDREYYFASLDKNFPGLKERYLKRYGNAYMCDSDQSVSLYKIFDDVCEQHGIMHDADKILTWVKTFPVKQHGDQLSMFDML